MYTVHASNPRCGGRGQGVQRSTRQYAADAVFSDGNNGLCTRPIELSFFCCGISTPIDRCHCKFQCRPTANRNLHMGYRLHHVTDDVIMVKSSLFFKMLLRQFLSELVHTLTQCSPIWCVYMILTDSRSGSYNVTDDVITCNHCRNFGAKYLGNDAR